MKSHRQLEKQNGSMKVNLQGIYCSTHGKRLEYAHRGGSIVNLSSVYSTQLFAMILFTASLPQLLGCVQTGGSQHFKNERPICPHKHQILAQVSSFKELGCARNVRGHFKMSAFFCELSN